MMVIMGQEKVFRCAVSELWIVIYLKYLSITAKIWPGKLSAYHITHQVVCPSQHYMCVGVIASPVCSLNSKQSVLETCCAKVWWGQRCLKGPTWSCALHEKCVLWWKIFTQNCSWRVTAAFMLKSLMIDSNIIYCGQLTVTLYTVANCSADQRTWCV